MGKEEWLQHQQQQIHGSEDGGGGHSSDLFCDSCSTGLSRFSKHFSFKCVFVLILSLFLLVSGIFWIHRPHKLRLEGFDAASEIKLSATVQAYFRLQKPVSQLIPHIQLLEYDIFAEIGVPDTKVSVLSMHQEDASNWTNVVFGVLSDRMNVPINQVFLSVLRSSLIELYLQQSNLTLTTSIFGEPSGFKILKFPEGITVIPVQYASIWLIPQILFNFTLNNSISEILPNLVELKDQLKFGLYLRPYENVFVQITNMAGSTEDPLVTVQASVMSDQGSLLPQRLKQLAQTITDSPTKNLGLDNSVFGKVKSVILSSYLKGTLHGNSLSPAPSPELSDYAEPPVSPYPAFTPSSSPAPSPDFHNSDGTNPNEGSHPSSPPVNSPAHSIVKSHPPWPCPQHGNSIPPAPRSSSPHPIPAPYFQPVGPPSQLPPDLSPIPVVSFGSSPQKGSGSQSLAPSPSAPSPLSSSAVTLYGEIWLLGFFGLVFFHLLW